MAKQTAVHFLFEIWNSKEPFDKFISDEQFEQAQAMEKEQIINAYIEGEHQQGFQAEAEQYYNETYNK